MNNSTYQDHLSIAAAYNDYVRILQNADTAALQQRLEWVVELHIPHASVAYALETDPAIADLYCCRFGVDLASAGSARVPSATEPIRTIRYYVEETLV